MISLNLVLFFNVKCEFELENWLFPVSYLTIVLSCYYLSNGLTTEMVVYMWDEMKQQVQQDNKGDQENTNISS